MPLLTRVFIRISFIYLAAALFLGLLLALRASLPFPGWLATAGPVYFHLFLVGWITQLIFGTIIWLFPRSHPGRSEREEQLGWATLLLLNGGLLLRVVGEPASVGRPGSIWGWLLVVSAALQWTASLTFTALAWSRSRMSERHKRKA